MKVYILTDEKGRRFCRDGEFREFALFGTGRTCVKQYRRDAYAYKAARKAGLDCWTIYAMDEGDTMDVFGDIERA